MNAKTLMFAMAFSAGSAAAQPLDLVPDTLAKAFHPGGGSEIIDSIQLVNTSGSAIRVDSITIRFLDGAVMNPATGLNDFKMCSWCPDPDDFNQNRYGGWLHGTKAILRYLRDSLYVLKDSHRQLVSLKVEAGGSESFVLRYIVNCPVCGRLPSYPETTRYRYVFHLAGGGEVSFLLRNSAPTALAPALKAGRGKNPEGIRLDGRKPVAINVGRPGGVVSRRPNWTINGPVGR